MNKKHLLLISVPFIFSGCQSLPTHLKDNEAMMIEAKSPNLLQTLADYTWSKQTHENLPPITLNLDAEKKLSISSGCNHLMGVWQFDGKQMNTSPLASTLMMCPPHLMAQEQSARQFFNQAHLNVSIDMRHPAQPTLILENMTGQKIKFQGTLKPEAQYKSTGEVIFLEISPTKKACSTSNGSKQCLQVKQIQYNDQGVQTRIDESWQVLPVEIQGYEHDSGLRQVIRVKRFNTKPQTATPEYAYIYDMTVEQEVIPKK